MHISVSLSPISNFYPELTIFTASAVSNFRTLGSYIKYAELSYVHFAQGTGHLAVVLWRIEVYNIF